MELESHELSPEPLSPVEEHRVLCDRCRGIVTNESSKYNDLQASVTPTLWQTSYFPSQSELDDNETLLDELFCQREAYDHEISRIRDVLDLLVTNRRRVNRCIYMYDSLSAPIRRLPVDILMHIFRHALCFDVSPSRSFSAVFLGEGTMTSLRLAKVCHLWREIIFQNPRLWTHQAYRIRDSTNVEMVSIYQKESFPHSLDFLIYSKDIDLDCDSTASNEDEELDYVQECRIRNMRQLMQGLDSSRCRRLSWDQASYTRHQYDWSALEVLEIHAGIMDLSKGSPFACAPQLRTLCLMISDYRLGVDQMAKFCPWEQIQDLSVADEKSDLVNLCSAGCLRRLTLDGLPWGQYRNRLSSIKPEILACLQEVRFVDGWVLEFFSKIALLGSMGCLSTLELSTINNRSSRLDDLAAISVVPPCPSLRHLIIRDLLIPTDSLIPLIRASDNLQSLMIIEPRSLHELDSDNSDNGIITSDVLEAVRGRRLDHLEIRLAKDSHLRGRQSNILDTIEYLHPISLKSAVVGIRGGVELLEDTLERMKELRKGGLQIWSA